MVELYKRTYTSRALEITIALLLFALGGGIYVAFRSTSLRMFDWFNYIGLHDIVLVVRSIANGIHLPSTILYCIPDGLWTLSYIILMDAIWSPDVKKQLLFGGIIPFFGVTLEIFQYFNLSRGTFDVVDLSLYIVPYVVYLILKIKL